jgi:hypothetical protein
VSGSDICGFFSLLSENPIVDPLRAFLLLLCTGKCREVRLFLEKSRVGIGHSVYTGSENALTVSLRQTFVFNLLNTNVLPAGIRLTIHVATVS